jgi:carbamoyl-phosphate synthase small subunit
VARTNSQLIGRLMLEEGPLIEGFGFGYPSDVSGEVVFNTGMVGYTETLTDPSYRGQILCLTYPLVGNYGVPDMQMRDQFGLPRFFESLSIQVRGLLVHDLSNTASHWSCTKNLDQWLYEQKIPGIYGIDTRELTKRLRVRGVMMGAMSVALARGLSATKKFGTFRMENNSKGQANRSQKAKLRDQLDQSNYDLKNFMPEVSTSRPEFYLPTGTLPKSSETGTIALLDTGTKFSIIRNILALGFRVVRLPWNSSYDLLKSFEPLGVVISNGPGDPKVCRATISTAKKLIQESIPTLGICLGNQILALAAGADTYKLKYGHRGQNKPCIDVNDNTTYITSQNHGYGIETSSLEKTDFKIWFYNPDDDTIEGIQHESRPIIAVQFHPEASPGPYDCIFVFERFKDMILNHYSRTRSRIT